MNHLYTKINEWNLKINLISRNDIIYLLPNHILPSLSISKIKLFYDNNLNIIDVGTGGGFPGLPLAIINPTASFTLLDSNTKKMTVVQDIVNSLELTNVKVIISRAELYTTEKFDFILGLC